MVGFNVIHGCNLMSLKFKPGRNVTTLQGSGRNVTMDNYFTGVPLAKTTLQRKLTIVGTLKK